MSAFKGVRRPVYYRLLQISLFVLTISTLSSATSVQNSRERVEGVRNFGRVTDRYFRGGQVTPAGVKRLAEMGVKTIVDLRDKPSEGEPEACEQNGIKYYKFPMDGHAIPDDKTVNEVLSIIQNANGRIYVHCSAGKHRAGTIAALYRIRVQGWSKDKAWAEQRSYGFGPPEEHLQLYTYVYGQKPASADMKAVAYTKQTEEDDEEEESSKSKSKDKSSKSEDEDSDDDDDDGEDEDDDDGEDEDDDDDGDDDDGEDDDDDDDGDKGKDKKDADSDKSDKRSAKADDAEESESSEISRPEPAERSLNSAVGRLSADASYITLADAIKRAKAEGASGELLKVDLEWDELRSVTTWDVTFSSGTEYEVDAKTGKFLGAEPKAAGKLAVLSPLQLDGSEKRLLTFQDIIKKAEKRVTQSIVEMELKRIKGRSQTVFEVALADGSTSYYDAVTGEAISNL